MENEKLFELVEKMYADLKGSQEKMNSEMQLSFKQITERLDKVENIVTKIEQEHGQKLQALFDGYKQNSDKLDMIEKEVSKHEEVILRRVK